MGVLREVPADVRRTLDDAFENPDPLGALAGSERLWHVWARWQQALASEAIQRGATWDDIGRALGTSRQSAWARFKWSRARGAEDASQDPAENRARRDLVVRLKELKGRAKEWDAKKRLEREQVRQQLRAIDKERAEERRRVRAEIAGVNRELRSWRIARAKPMGVHDAECPR